MSDDNRKISVMTGTLLYVFGSCERHSELTEEVYIPMRRIPKEDTDVSMNWIRNIHWQTEVLDSWKVTQLNLLLQRLFTSNRLAG